jgi:hypothetical protein
LVDTEIKTGARKWKDEIESTLAVRDTR